jgi:PTS system fructose-specific IIA component
MPVISADLVDLDLDRVAHDRAEATRALAQRLADAGRVTDVDAFLEDVAAREAQMPTGIEGGIGIPHARSSFVTQPTLAFGRHGEGVDFGAADGPAHLVFLIAAPTGGDADHMSILANLARRLVHQEFRQALLDAADPDAVVDLVTREVVNR